MKYSYEVSTSRVQNRVWPGTCCVGMAYLRKRMPTPHVAHTTRPPSRCRHLLLPNHPPRHQRCRVQQKHPAQRRAQIDVQCLIRCHPARPIVGEDACRCAIILPRIPGVGPNQVAIGGLGVAVAGEIDSVADVNAVEQAAITLAFRDYQGRSGEAELLQRLLADLFRILQVNRVVRVLPEADGRADDGAIIVGILTG